MSCSGILRIIPTTAFTLKKTCAAAFSAKAPVQRIVKEVDPSTGELTSKKTNIIQKITLLMGNSVEVTTLAEAEKLSKRRDLKLIKLIDQDPKSQRPVYKLMTGPELHAEDLRQKEKHKHEKGLLRGEKIMLVHSRISQNDLQTHLKKADKWVQKMFQVRVVISGAGGGTAEPSEKIFSAIEKHFNTEDSAAKVVNKAQKGADIKCQIVPRTPSQGPSDDL